MAIAKQGPPPTPNTHAHTPLRNTSKTRAWTMPQLNVRPDFTLALHVKHFMEHGRSRVVQQSHAAGPAGAAGDAGAAGAAGGLPPSNQQQPPMAPAAYGGGGEGGACMYAPLSGVVLNVLGLFWPWLFVGGSSVVWRYHRAKLLAVFPAGRCTRNRLWVSFSMGRAVTGHVQDRCRGFRPQEVIGTPLLPLHLVLALLSWG